MNRAANLVYSFSINRQDISDINFVCSDDRIHFRFKDYIKSEIIRGFEKKLTYLLSYLFNFDYKLKNTTNKPFKEVLNDFLHTSDIIYLTKIIEDNITYKNFKGLKGRVSYNKTNATQYPFGKINKEYFPVDKEGEINIS